jgi:hypothetical protein
LPARISSGLISHAGRLTFLGGKKREIRCAVSADVEGKPRDEWYSAAEVVVRYLDA